MEFRKLAVIGGGPMGRSIAQKVAASGLDVEMIEVSEARAGHAREALVAGLDQELAKWGITVSEKKAMLSRLRFGHDLAAAAGTDLVIETVTEDLAVKKTLMRSLHQVCPPERILVTNTSTLSVTEIAAASGRPDRVVGVHFMYPAARSPIVEVVRGAETSDATYQAALELARVLGKSAVSVFDSPGYVVTRTVLPFLNEAIHVVMEGVASAEDVDRALRLGYEFRMGPLEYCDRVGLDKVLGWMEHLFRETGEARFRPCPLLRRLVRAGHLGRKSGHGFFTWKAGERVPATGGSAEPAP